MMQAVKEWETQREWWMSITGVCHTHLEWVKTGNDSAVFHLTALGRVGKLALVVRPRTRSSLKFPTHLQRQPLRVPHRCHIHRHFKLKQEGVVWGELADQQACFSLVKPGQMMRRDRLRTSENKKPKTKQTNKKKTASEVVLQGCDLKEACWGLS